MTRVMIGVGFTLIMDLQGFLLTLRHLGLGCCCSFYDGLLLGTSSKGLFMGFLVLFRVAKGFLVLFGVVRGSHCDWKVIEFVYDDLRNIEIDVERSYDVPSKIKG